MGKDGMARAIGVGSDREGKGVKADLGDLAAMMGLEPIQEGDRGQDGGVDGNGELEEKIAGGIFVIKS